MKEKIVAAIKAKFPAINLSKARLNAIAAKIESIVIDDETRIDAQLDAFNNFTPFADIAKQDDKIRDLEAKVKVAPAKKDPEPVIEPPVVDDDTPAWAKALIESNKTLSQGLATLQGEKVQSAMRTKATEKLKDIPASYWSKRPIPEKDEELDAFVTDVTTDYEAFTKEMTDKGLTIISIPKASTIGEGGAGSTKIDPEIKKFTDAQAARDKKEAAQV